MKKNILFRQIVLCIFLMQCFSWSGAQTAKEFNNTGYNFFNKKQYDSAIDNYTAAISLQPDYPLAYYNRGHAYYEKRLYDQAIKDYDKVISLNPDHVNAYQSRGNSYFNKKNYDLALIDYNETINASPNNAVNYYNRGNLYNAKKMHDAAIKDFDQSIMLNPKYVPAYQGRATAYNNRKEYDLAIKDFNQVVMLNANFVNGYQGRGIAYNYKKEFDLAIQDFSKAISIDTNFHYAYNSRGLSYLFKGAYDLAVPDFRKSISLDVKKERPFVIINIIEPLARLYRFSEAAEYYREFRSEYKTGYIDFEGWQFFKKYVEAITQNLTKNDYSAALANLSEAESLYNTNNKVESVDDSRKRGYSSILALKGYVLERLNSNEAARQAYEQTLLINTLQPDVTIALQRLSKKEEVLVHQDNTPPVINILEPLLNNRAITVEDDKVAGTSQRIRGRAIDPSGIRSLMINNRPLKVEESGYFDTTVTINDGVNVFTIVVTDKNANSVSENVQIITGKDKGGSSPIVEKPIQTVLNDNPVYHAVLIAENDYLDKNIPSLQGPVTDMNKIYNLLVNNYVFAPQHTDTLVNATRANILEAIIKKANAMKENDNLFIFYAGHGQMITQPDKSEEGFLVPQDAVKGMLSSYISSDDLLRTIKYSKAKHILFVADACFAGSLFRDISTNAPLSVSLAYKDKSRKLLASGNRTVVPDKSEFIEYLRLSLQENREQYITAEQLIDSFKDQYKSTTHLQLQYYPIKNVDDLGGQFVFIRK